MAAIHDQLTRQTRERLGQICGRVADIAGHFTITELAVTETSPRDMPVTEVSDPAQPLALAVLVVESNLVRDGWGKPPQLYALADKAALIAADPGLGITLRETPDRALIPVLQRPLEVGEPSEVLACIYWEDAVTGCVLVTEIIVLPPEAEHKAPQDPGAVERWASDHRDGQSARLAVGVCRDGQYTCILRLKGDHSVQLNPRLADDLVTTLLGTF